MQWMKGLVLLTVGVLIASLFYTWVTIDSKDIVVTGFQSKGTSFGKPGIFHIFLMALYLVFFFISRPWSLRAAFFVTTFNIAWAVRNFFIIPACHAGICPVKHTALYLVLVSSFLLSIFSLFLQPAFSRHAGDE